MIYDIQYTERATNDLKNIVHYISHVLRNDVAAVNVLNLLSDSIDKLNTMPERYPLVEGKMSKSFKDRKMSIRNYVIIYNVDKTKRIVWIVRIMNCLINTNG